jgi:hypothetical protein
MSKITDWIIDQETNGAIIFNEKLKEYVKLSSKQSDKVHRQIHSESSPVDGAPTSSS